MDELFSKIAEFSSPEIEHKIRDFINKIALEKSSSTCKSYLFDIWIGLRFFCYKTWAEVINISVKDFRNLCATRRDEGISIASQQRMVIAWKVLLRHMGINSLENFKVPRVQKRHPKPILAEIVDLILVMDVRDWQNLRNKALWMLMYGSGMRISEALSLKVLDVDERSILIEGKGQKQRLVPILPNVREWIIEYLEKRPFDSDLVFLAANGKPLLQQNAAQIFRRWADKIGIDRRFTLHSLRHAFATHMLHAGCPLPGIQKLLGHSQLSTTAQYIEVEDLQLQKHLDQIRSVPI